MAAGADKLIAFDPPGAIGLAPIDAAVYLRFDETTAAQLPQDAAGALQDLDVTGALVMPPVIDGVLGQARSFAPAASRGLVTTDIVSGSSLFTRDLTIQAVLSWSAVSQNSAGTPGTIVARGKGGSSAEYAAYGLEIAVVDAPSFTGELRWLWHDTAGVLKTQTGAQFSLPSGFTMLTATRRWISPTSVLLRYYIGDLFLGEVSSSDGSIGGGTTGTFQVGTRWTGAAFAQFLAGSIDELAIWGREMCREEIEATWLRITKYQPLGQQLYLEMHDPGFPRPTDPGSDFMREARLIGHGLGYAAAQAENLRANALPGRAYGTTLDDWETVVRPTLQPPRDIDTRRARIVARMRQRRGSSPPGLQDSLADLVDTDVANLQFLAFSNEIVEDFTTLNALRWDTTPVGSFTAVSGKAHCAPGAGTYLMNGVVQDWKTAAMATGGDARQAHIISKLALTTPQAGVEVGVWFGDKGANNFLLLGLRDDAGTFKIVTESIVASVSAGAVVRATLGGNPAALWLHLYQIEIPDELPEDMSNWKAAWSTTSATSGFATSSDIVHSTIAHWSGIYLRSTGALGAGPVVDFDDHTQLCPFGTRPFNAYVYRPIGLGGAPDIDGSHSVIQAIKHAFVEGTIIQTLSVLCDDPNSLVGRGPMGVL